jgi:predicted DNA-binding ribbon-helix-helix protein
MKSAATKRTVRIDGRRASICLEDAFWSALQEIAQAHGATVSQTITEIYKSRQGENLASAIRLFVRSAWARPVFWRLLANYWPALTSRVAELFGTLIVALLPLPFGGRLNFRRPIK